MAEILEYRNTVLAEEVLGDQRRALHQHRKSGLIDIVSLTRIYARTVFLTESLETTFVFQLSAGKRKLTLMLDILDLTPNTLNMLVTELSQRACFMGVERYQIAEWLSPVRTWLAQYGSIDSLEHYLSLEHHYLLELS